MAIVLGATDLPFVTVPHPISSATPDELDQIARAATAECVRLITQRP